MIPQNKKALKEASPYTGVITREQFLFYEMRTTARLAEEGLTDTEIADRICNENLFQYPYGKVGASNGVYLHPTPKSTG